MISKQAQAILANAITDEAKAAADLSARKTELALEAQELLNKAGLSGIKAIEMAFWFSDEAENSVVEFIHKKSGGTLSLQGRKEMLDYAGSHLVRDFTKQYEQAREGAIRRQKEARAGITRK